MLPRARTSRSSDSNLLRHHTFTSNSVRLHAPRLNAPPKQTAGAFLSWPANLRPRSHFASCHSGHSRRGVRLPLLPWRHMSRTPTHFRIRMGTETAGTCGAAHGAGSGAEAFLCSPVVGRGHGCRKLHLGICRVGQNDGVGQGVVNDPSSHLRNVLVLVLIADLLSVRLLPAETRRRHEVSDVWTLDHEPANDSRRSQHGPKEHMEKRSDTVSCRDGERFSKRQR
jgi:hypothetical protein